MILQFFIHIQHKKKEKHLTLRKKIIFNIKKRKHKRKSRKTSWIVRGGNRRLFARINQIKSYKECLAKCYTKNTTNKSSQKLLEKSLLKLQTFPVNFVGKSSLLT